MVLILGEEQDETTNDVIDWLWYHGKEVIRINREDDVQIHELDAGKFVLHLEDQIIDSDQADSFWYRRVKASPKLETKVAKTPYLLMAPLRNLHRQKKSNT